MAGNIYSVGQIIRLSVAITQSGSGVDPAALSLIIKDPTGTETTFTYASAQIQKDSTGNYHYDVTASYAGTYQLRWLGTGSAAGAQQDSFIVQALNV